MSAPSPMSGMSNHTSNSIACLAASDSNDHRSYHVLVCVDTGSGSNAPHTPTADASSPGTKDATGYTPNTQPHGTPVPQNHATPVIYFPVDYRGTQSLTSKQPHRNQAGDRTPPWRTGFRSYGRTERYPKYEPPPKNHAWMP